MQTKTINIYSFNELSEKVQKEVIERFRNDTERDFPFLEEDIKDRLENLLKDNDRIKNVDDLGIYYSLSYSQGDGAMFYGRFIFIDSENKEYMVRIEHSGRYYHYNSKIIHIDTIEERQENIDYNEIENKVNDIYIKICKELTSYGYAYIEDCTSDTYIKDEILNNEYDFLEDGTLANNIK